MQRQPHDDHFTSYPRPAARRKMITHEAQDLPRRRLTCSCCGSDAGRWAQHWNRDTGYGICPKCVEWLRTRYEPDEMIRLYGTPGINHEEPTTT
jgi:predicted amidophosphoribosyltransferase